MRSETDTAAGIERDENNEYEVIVVGGGPGGLTTALYTARMNHDTAVINRGGGRASMMQDAHNIIGVTEDISGNEFLSTAIEQIEYYGADHIRGTVTDISERDDSFEVEADDETYTADRVVLATGFNDIRPEPPLPRTGRGLHYCLYCDGYMFRDKSVYVMGHNTTAAYVSMIMLNFTDDVDLITRGEEPTWDDETEELLHAHPVDVIEEDVTEIYKDDDNPEWLGGFEFEDGTKRDYKGGFAMYGSEYNNELARQLGCEIEGGEVVVDDKGRTSVKGVYAVGDLTPGRKQIPIAMGEGAKAGIAIHKELREYPKTELLTEKEATS